MAKPKKTKKNPDKMKVYAERIAEAEETLGLDPDWTDPNWHGGGDHKPAKPKKTKKSPDKMEVYRKRGQETCKLLNVDPW